MNRRLTDSPIYRDFRDLAGVMLLIDLCAGVIFLVLWHLI